MNSVEFVKLFCEPMWLCIHFKKTGSTISIKFIIHMVFALIRPPKSQDLLILVINIGNNYSIVEIDRETSQLWLDRMLVLFRCFNVIFG